MTYVPAYSARRAYWPNQETIQDWVPTAINSAGSFDLATDGTILCGRRTKSATLIWTTLDLWSANYIGQPFIYSFRQEGVHCGIISGQAAVVLDTGAYWMGQGKFFLFDGFVRPIPCEVTDYVFGNFNQSLAATVWALPNPAFHEVTWFYPSAAAVSVPDSYVTYNYVEGHWTFGTLTRTCGVAYWPGVTTTPVMVDGSGNIFTHETGTAHGGAVPFLESGPVETGNGDNVMRVQRIVPDDKTLGQVQAKLYASFFPDQAETLNGPYALANPTSIRLTARQVRVRLEEAIASAWRVGVVRLGIVVGGRR